MAKEGYSNVQNLEMNKLENGSPTQPRKTVTVLGSGDFGRALTKRLSLAGYDVVIGSRNPERRQHESSLLLFRVLSIDEALNHSDIVFLAIPRDGYDATVTSLSSQLKGKILIDVSNRTQTAYESGSNAEYLASLVPDAHVVKGFNVISAWSLESDVYGGSRLVYVCGDDATAKEKVIGIARSMQFNAMDQGSLKMASNIENKPLELFPSWRVAIAMVGVLYLFMVLYFVVAMVAYGSDFTNFPLRSMSLIFAFTVIGILDMVYLPGCLAALLQLAYGTKYRRFPRWLDSWMKARKQLGLIALTMAAMHGCMSTLYWSPVYKSRLFQKTTTNFGNVSIVEYKKMLAQGEAFLTLGVLALTALSILGVTSLPTVLNRMSWREWNFVQSGMGYFSLIFALLHFTIYAYKGIPKWKPQFFFYPTVLIVLIGYAVVILRFILLLPCIANKVKKIRSGWERGGELII
ncbi:metalloreductase STEAP4-like [Dendronephthya gigantea]|uniref:metalloreductase STEAP4-like n=1 Tax=Dendronephthya gigantea TaxID=151771 RepID=UPI00106B4449|nr:metalloreductase STEAP4-like [Dendronephthya gigantea]XP_028409986.1 metalloreductase STEAP4-like [Dendronephthya gigantea]